MEFSKHSHYTHSRGKSIGANSQYCWKVQWDQNNGNDIRKVSETKQRKLDFSKSRIQDWIALTTRGIFKKPFKP